MDIFRILKEAKDPSPNRQVIRVRTNNTDYTEDVENDTTEPETTNIDTTENEESSDYTEDVEEVEPDEEAEEPAEDEESTDYTEDVDSDDEYGEDAESTDYTEGVDDGEAADEETSEGQSEEQEELSPEEKLEKQQNNGLLKNVTDLFYSIIGIINKLDNTTYPTVLANKISGQVKKNLNELSDYIYILITGPFKNNTYVKNLYIYNYCIEAYKLNIMMLEKIGSVIK